MPAELIPTELLDRVRRAEVLRWSLSKRVSDSCGELPEKLSAKLIQTSAGPVFQQTRRSEKQEFHRNQSPTEAVETLQSLFGTNYRRLNLHTLEADYELRFKSGSGTVRLKTMKPSLKDVSGEHDRIKSSLLPIDKPLPFLIEAGLMTSAGKLKSTGQNKFRQINRYLEFVRDVLLDLDQTETVRIVDFGCGKSYLTFALHYWLTEVEQRPVEMIGLDRDPHVIEHCRGVVERLGIKSLRFEQGDIASFNSTEPVEMVISLHACDTATDDALRQAVAWDAKVILAVPCCQHEVFTQLNSQATRSLTRHGILKERLCSMVTDSLRALALEANGYRTQVIEFIDMEHTPKNVLIRAVKQNQFAQQSQAVEDYRSQKTFWGLGKINTDLILPN